MGLAAPAVDGAPSKKNESDKKGLPLFIAMGGTPGGFENLAEPQKVVVDVYFGNRFIATHTANVTPTTIMLQDPERLVGMIGDIREREIVSQALSGTLDTNSQMACSIRSLRSQCGTINPLVAGVIFDDSRFRLDVFINRHFMLTRSADVNKYLAPSDVEGFSFMQNMGGAWSGMTGDVDDNDFTFSGGSKMAWSENSVQFNWDYSKEQQFSVNDLYYSRDFKGKEYRGGVFGTQGMGLTFTPDRTVVGGRIASSDNTRNDVQFSSGMPVNVFLPTRGIVEIRRDGRLIASFMQEAGSQQLNTSSFPSGAYDIEIRIVDEGGQEISKETRFFTKSMQLPPSGEWLYFAEAGQVLDRTSDGSIPDSTDQILARGGVSRRLSDNWSSTLALAMDKDDLLSELSFFHLAKNYEITPSLMLSDDGSYGFSTDMRMYFSRGISAYLSYRQLESNKTADEAYDLERPSMLGESFKQANAGASVPIYRGVASYNYTIVDNDNNYESSKTHSINYRTNIFRSNDYDVDTNISYSTSNETDIAQINFELRLRDDKWTYRARPYADYTSEHDGESSTDSNLELAATWDSNDLFDTDVIADLGATVGTDQDRYEARLQAENSWGRGDLAVNHLTGDASLTSYVANFNTTFIANSSNIALGGSQMADSALVVNVKGEDGDVFDVLVDGAKHGYAVAGRSSVIPLSPFRQYDINVVPSDSELYHFNERVKTVTLYPGNVKSMDYKMEPIKVLIGRLLMDGKILPNTRIVGSYYPTETDEYGIFQLEVRSGLKTLYIETEDGQICHLGLVPDSRKKIQRVGSLDLAENGVCVRPEEATDEVRLAMLPADEWE